MNLIKPADVLAFGKKHLPTILSAASIIGVGATGYFSYRAGKKVEENNGLGCPTKWTIYILPVVCGAATIVCIIASDRLHVKKELALAAAVAFWKENYEKFDAKVAEVLGEEKTKELKRKIVKDDISKKELPKDFDANDGKMLCYEPYTKQFFRASKEQLLWAELTANKIFAGKGRTKLNDIIWLFPGCKKKPIGDTIGWFLDDTGCYNASYYLPGCGCPFIDIQPYPSTINGVDCLVIEYGLCPYEPDEPEEWK